MVTEVWSSDGDSGIHTGLRGNCVERKYTWQEWSQARKVPLRPLIPQELRVGPVLGPPGDEDRADIPVGLFLA